MCICINEESYRFRFIKKSNHEKYVKIIVGNRSHEINEIELTEYSFLWLIDTCSRFPNVSKMSFSLQIEYITTGDGRFSVKKLSDIEENNLILKKEFIEYLRSDYSTFFKIFNYLDNKKDFTDLMILDLHRDYPRKRFY